MQISATRLREWAGDSARQLRGEWKAGLLVAAVVGLLVLLLREAGMVEPAELAAHDALLGVQTRYPADRRIALVRVTEAELSEHKGMLPDAVLATALASIAQAQPRAIGLDIYRGQPAPPGTEDLEAVFRSDRRIIGILKLPEGRTSGLPPPPVLARADRIGFSDILVDPDGMVRRGLLYIDDGTTNFPSFSLRLALVYLKREGIGLEPDPGTPDGLVLGKVVFRRLEADEGGYVRADPSGYQFLLDFKGSASPFMSVDLNEVLTGSVDPSVFRDRIVIVGTQADSTRDTFYSPGSQTYGARQVVYGLELHARMVSQLLRMALGEDPPVHGMPEWREQTLILLAAAGGVLAALVIPALATWAAVLVAVLVALTAFAFGALIGGWWIPLVPVAAAWSCSSVAMKVRTWHRDRVQMRQLFASHVSAEVFQEIWRNRDELLDRGRLRPQRMQATALFTDLSGFTPVAEQLEPEAVLDWLNEYFDAMAREVKRHGGVIRQFAGDAVVAVFGVPFKRTNGADIDRDARNAVACAIAMETELEKLNARWKAEGRTTISMRIGIYTGRVVTGTMGSRDRFEFVIEGDTMNTASRLESFDKTLFAPDPEARVARIFIGEPTQRRLGSEFRTEHVGEASLKGKEQRVNIYRVITP